MAKLKKSEQNNNKLNEEELKNVTGGNSINIYGSNSKCGGVSQMNSTVTEKSGEAIKAVQTRLGEMTYYKGEDEE